MTGSKGEERGTGWDRRVWSTGSTVGNNCHLLKIETATTGRERKKGEIMSGAFTAVLTVQASNRQHSVRFHDGIILILL